MQVTPILYHRTRYRRDILYRELQTSQLHGDFYFIKIGTNVPFKGCAMENWREVLRESIVYGLLFKAVAIDAASIDQMDLKMSYRPVLDGLSLWAERKHHEYRRQFGQLGGKIHVQETRDGFIYYVLVTVHGLRYENIYSREILRAECQDRLNHFFKSGIQSK